MALKVTGVGLSPFVRKVRVVLAEKGLEYEHDPMLPMGVSDEYKQKHPMGKVPILEDGDRLIPDSSAISNYLEGIAPEPALYPSDAYDRARAIWIEEFADTGVIGGTATVFQERVLGPLFFKREGDQAKIDEALNQTLPPFFDYLEKEIGDDDWIVGNAFSIADVALGTQFANFAIADAEVDAKRWPKLAAYVVRVHARPSFKKLMDEDRGAKAAAVGG